MDFLLDCLRAAAEPTRLRLLAICASGELTVSELVAVLGQSQPRVSRHLKLLCEAGLLERFREQNFVFYRAVRRGQGGMVLNRILACLPEQDPVLDLDKARVADTLRRRLTEVRDVVDDLKERAQLLNDLTADEAALSAQVDEILGDHTIGELLDVGTGSARMLKLLGPRADGAVGIDISRDMRQVARLNLHRAGLAHISIRHGDMYHLNYPDGSFGTITIHQVLNLADRPMAVIQEAARLLQPHGRLLVLDFKPSPALAALDPPIQGIAPKTVISQLKKAGFKKVTQRIVGGASVDIHLTAGMIGAADGARALA